MLPGRHRTAEHVLDCQQTHHHHIHTHTHTKKRRRKEKEIYVRVQGSFMGILQFPHSTPFAFTSSRVPPSPPPPLTSLFIIFIIYPLTARIAWAPQTISQPVSSFFPSSTLPYGTWWSLPMFAPGKLRILPLFTADQKGFLTRM